jgi:hypothetical protein
LADKEGGGGGEKEEEGGRTRPATFPRKRATYAGIIVITKKNAGHTKINKKKGKKKAVNKEKKGGGRGEGAI